MVTNLPVHVPARASVARNACFAGVLPIAGLERLAAALAEPAGELTVELKAQSGAGGAPYLRGSVAGEVTLLCQRCLRTFAQALTVPVDLRLVESEDEEQRLLQECEPYPVTGDRLRLHEIVEDEVLLALPLSPRCGRADCGEVATEQASPG